MQSPLSNSRIASLDGLRGIAILWVVSFHYFTLWPRNRPLDFSYGTIFSDFTLFKYGGLGVMLFFSISGFVIAQTLHNSSTATSFAIKRFARLWPAMLICSLMTYAFSFVTPQIYAASAKSFIPSLTFLEPRVLNTAFGKEYFSWMDPSYWSLFTEIRFYVLAALIYFTSKSNFFRVYWKLSLLVGILFPISILLEANELRKALSLILIAPYLPWFSFGIGCYCLFAGKKSEAQWLLVTSALSLAFYTVAATTKPFMEFDGIAEGFGAMVIFGLMLGSIRAEVVAKLLAWKPLSLLGLISYSLYLLHQNIGGKIIIMIGNPFSLPEWLSGTYALVTILVLSLVSLALFRVYERPLNILINKHFNGPTHQVHQSNSEKN